MSLTTSQEEKLHRTLGVLIDATPPVRDLEDLGVPRARRMPARRPRPAVALVVLFAAVALFVPLLLRSSVSAPTGMTDGEPDPIATAATPQTASSLVPDGAGRFSVMQEVPGTGDIVALEHTRAYISHDGGETWSEILRDGGADLLGLTPDGAVVAVRNGRESVLGELGPDSSVWGAPEVLRYDPVGGAWSGSELPRPDLPVPDAAAMPLDGGAGECPLGGLQWKWGAQSIATGGEMVILGEHRIVAAGVCDEAFHFAWTSPDGATWTVIDDIGIDGHPVGLAWFEGRYVAYGSADPWFAWQLDRLPEIWSSTDLIEWDTAELDLSPLPDLGYVSIFPDNESSWGTPTIDAASVGGVLSLAFQVERARQDLDADISDVEELADWLAVNRGEGYADDPGAIASLEEVLSTSEVDFPLDGEEIEVLSSLFAAADLAGRFVAETTDGLTWTTRYEE